MLGGRGVFFTSLDFSHLSLSFEQAPFSWVLINDEPLLSALLRGLVVADFFRNLRPVAFSIAGDERPEVADHFGSPWCLPAHHVNLQVQIVEVALPHLMPRFYAALDRHLVLYLLPTEASTREECSHTNEQ